MLKNLEHHEHAEHLAEHDHEAAGHGTDSHGHANQMAALLVAVLAASLAVTEQGAKHAEIRVQENSIFATDAWAQYQAKSTRGTFTNDLSALVAVLDPGDAALTEQRKALLDRLKKDQERFENDPKDGKTVIAERARAFEEARDYSLEQTHSYHNGAAAMELGIVLSTVSAITRSRLLIYMGLSLGIVGGIFALLGWFAPGYGAI
ncbi:MAG: DUF4337 family protein [Acetobacteraceae bacterium]|jgi:hypothetical protein